MYTVRPLYCVNIMLMQWLMYAQALEATGSNNLLKPKPSIIYMCIYEYICTCVGVCILYVFIIVFVSLVMYARNFLGSSSGLKIMCSIVNMSRQIGMFK